MKRKKNRKRKYGTVVTKKSPDMYIILRCMKEDICIGFSKKPLDKVYKKSLDNKVHYKPELGNRLAKVFMIYRDGYEIDFGTDELKGGELVCPKCQGEVKIFPFVSDTKPELI